MADGSCTSPSRRWRLGPAVGLRIPDDLSVIGFDDLPEAGWASPPLTTVRRPLSEMGSLAARTLVRLIRGEAVESPRIELSTRLVQRASVRALHP